MIIIMLLRYGRALIADLLEAFSAWAINWAATGNPGQGHVPGRYEA